MAALTHPSASVNSSPKGVLMHAIRLAPAAFLIAGLVGCGDNAPAEPEARFVRTLTVEQSSKGEVFSLTGHIAAKDEVSLAFRVDGQMIERSVRVGEAVSAGQVVARLDPQDQQNALRSAQAEHAAAQAALTQARLTFGRQQKLLAEGWTTRAKFDEAKQAFETAQAQVDSAQAHLRLAQDQLSYTVVFADAAGIVTAVGAEPGEVVRAGQMIVQLALDGGRDAVFDVPEQVLRTGPLDPAIEIVLADDPNVRASGRVREVAPQADAATRTFQVKIGIVSPTEDMRLGATVTGSITLDASEGIELPAGALTQADGSPAVWVLDPQSKTVSLRGVAVARFDAAAVVVSQGLETGETVVTAGAQALRPGQKVRPLGEAK